MDHLEHMDQLKKEIESLRLRRDELSRDLESANADVKLNLVGSKKAKATDTAVTAQTRHSALAQLVEGIDSICAPSVKNSRVMLASSRARN